MDLGTPRGTWGILGGPKQKFIYFILLNVFIYFDYLECIIILVKGFIFDEDAMTDMLKPCL